MVMPDQDKMLPPPDTYMPKVLYQYCEPWEQAMGPMSPMPGSGTIGETLTSPAVPTSAGTGPSPPAAHIPADFRPWAVMPCCKCWCHGTNPRPWRMMSPFPVSSNITKRSNSWDIPSNYSNTFMQTVGFSICSQNTKV